VDIHMDLTPVHMSPPGLDPRSPPWVRHKWIS